MDKDLATALALLNVDTKPTAPAPRKLPPSRDPRYKMLTHNGVTRTEKAWAELHGMTRDVLRKRLSRGMSVEEALSTPLMRIVDRTRMPPREVRQRLRELKERTPCTDCKQSFPYYVLDFDHVRGEKLFDLSGCKGWYWEAIEAEIAKCDVVCANCHRERTHQRASIE